MLKYGSRTARRHGFTLIELLVVIGIILVVAGLAYLSIPRYADRKMQYAADRLQGWLLGAKMQAKRDGRPTGLRIQFDSTNTATSLVYIQQPDDYAPPNSTCLANNLTVTFQPLTALLGPSQLPDQAPVQAGDYIEFNRGGAVYQISQVSLALTGNTITLLTTGPNMGTSTPFRILRAPRPQPGEEDLTLPDEVVVDLRGSVNPTIANTGSSGANPSRSRIPMRSVGGTQVYEILFSPAGNVIGSGTGQTTIHLWLTDINDVNNTDSRALLVTVQVGSGMIGVNSVAPGNDPYAFTKDGRASGM